LKLKLACSSAASVPGAVTLSVSFLSSDFATLTCLAGRFAAPPALLSPALEAEAFDSPPAQAFVKQRSDSNRNENMELSFTRVIFDFRKLLSQKLFITTTKRMHYIQSSGFFHWNGVNRVVRNQIVYFKLSPFQVVCEDALAGRHLSAVENYNNE
jgi:hypothetical protein